MRDQIFKTGKLLVKKVIEIGHTDRNEYYEVKLGSGKDNTVSVSIAQDERGTTMHCTCAHCSLFPHGFCSYKLAVIYYKGGLR